VAVVASEENTWPLPWYLRRYTSVGYWNDPADLPAEPAHPALVVTTPDLDEALAHRLGEDYVTEYYGLRPAQSVLVVLHVRRDLWDRFMETRTASP
jgi:predicted membrane-bound mannosyltransferase